MNRNASLGTSPYLEQLVERIAQRMQVAAEPDASGKADPHNASVCLIGIELAKAGIMPPSSIGGFVHDLTDGRYAAEPSAELARNFLVGLTGIPAELISTAIEQDAALGEAIAPTYEHLRSSVFEARKLVLATSGKLDGGNSPLDRLTRHVLGAFDAGELREKITDLAEQQVASRKVESAFEPG